MISNHSTPPDATGGWRIHVTPRIASRVALNHVPIQPLLLLQRIGLSRDQRYGEAITSTRAQGIILRSCSLIPRIVNLQSTLMYRTDTQAANQMTTRALPPEPLLRSTSLPASPRYSPSRDLLTMLFWLFYRPKSLKRARKIWRKKKR